MLYIHLIKKFGGIQLVLCGDFLQLPPVKNEILCFDAACWSRAIPNVIQTTTVFRQSNSDFVKLLNDIRIGKITSTHLGVLDKLTMNKVYPLNGILPTQIL